MTRPTGIKDLRVLVQISILGPIWQASDAISPGATESAHRPFLKFALEPLVEGFQQTALRL
jgi:hypothetical protein